jgi:chondroitin AC lyase
LAAMTLDRLGVHAAKAWFFQGDTVVCLGADIRADDAQAPLITTLDQCWARGGGIERGDGRVRHDGVVYRNIGDGELRAETVRKTGSWRTVDRLQGSDGPVSGDVFTAWIEHGASYAYRIDTGEGDAGTGPRVLLNTQAVQAVASAAGDLVQAVFRTAGEVRLPDGRVLGVDAPSLVQWRRGADGRETLVPGNPTQKVAGLIVRVGDRRVECVFSKDAALAGRPISKEIGR